MTKGKLVPKRRFKDFENDEDWEQRKLSLLAERFDNLRIPVTASNRIPGSTPYYGANGILDYVDGFTHDGEFVLIAEDGANDLNDYPVHYVNGKAWVNNHAHVIQAKEDISDNKFLKYSFKTLEIEPYLVGGSRAKLNADIMMNLIINTPKIDEQIKIGKFFTNLDNLITLHQRKRDKLKNLKLSYLSQMFPKEGEKHPRRRFAGFTDPWEQRKLAELINDIADGPFGSNLKTIHYTNEMEARIIQLSNIGESGWQNENVRYTTFEHAKEIKRSIVESGDLVMAKMMPAGLTIECPNIDKMYVLSSDAVKIKLNKSLVDTMYFIYMTKSNFFLNQINNDTQGSTRTRTSISKIRKMDIPIPTLLEQEKVGTFFLNLDKLITLHQRKLEKLEDTKKAYLSEMFV